MEDLRAAVLWRMQLCPYHDRQSLHKIILGDVPINAPLFDCVQRIFAPSSRRYHRVLHFYLLLAFIEFTTSYIVP